MLETPGGFGNFRGNYTRGPSNCESFWKKMIGKSRLSGRKLNVRFDEGELEIGGISYYASSLLYPHPLHLDVADPGRLKDEDICYNNKIMKQIECDER